MDAATKQVILKARNLSKVYQAGEMVVHALRDVSLDLLDGELAVILGASGSGKSTLLNILGGLDAPSSGELFYRDENLSLSSDRELTLYRRKHVGFVFQFYNLIPSLTARENVALVTDIMEQAMTPEIVAVIAAALLLQPARITVDVAGIENGTLVVAVEDQGRTRARDPYIVAAPIYGRLLRNQLREGDVVTTGQVIARIALPQEDTRTQAVLEANLRAAEARYEMVSAELMEAEAAYDRALREEDRRQRLAEDGLISREERESFRQLSIAAEVRVMSLSASINAVSAEVESARTQLLGTGSDVQDMVQNILSPVDGTLYRLFERNERVLAAGTPLMSISDQDALEIVVDLLTQDAVRVQAGDRMLISGWGGDTELEAEVVYVEPQAFTKISALGVEEQRVNVIGNFLEQPQNLGGEYRIEARIIVEELEDVPLIPTSAIFQRNNAWYAFVVEEGRAVQRQVEIGLRNQNFAQVLGLLNTGDQVILFPSDLINDGVAVAF